MPGGRKVSYILGGRADKPDRDYLNVSAGRFTKSTRNHKAITGNESRINPTTSAANKLYKIDKV